MSDCVKVIDVSHWQNFPDFWKVAAGGTLAVVHKATEGTSYVDQHRATNLSNAKRAGLAIATYHWLKPGSARPQIEHYLRTLDPVRGERVVIDYEEDGCTLTGLREAVQALLDAELDLQITVYSGHLLKQQLGVSCDNFLQEHTSLWIAQYTSAAAPSWPSGTYPQWSLWQYTDKGHVDGVSGNCDCNRFNGSDEALLRYINPVGHVAPEQPDQPDAEVAVVTITIEAPPNVKVVVNWHDEETGT